MFCLRKKFDLFNADKGKFFFFILLPSSAVPSLNEYVCTMYIASTEKYLWLLNGIEAAKNFFKFPFFSFFFSPLAQKCITSVL